MIAKTKSGLPKHCTYVIDRHGKRRVRFQRRGLSAYITGTPWSEEFMRQYGDLLDRAGTPTAYIGADRGKSGTVNALVTAYYRSPDFKNLEDSTVAHRRRIYDAFRAEYGDLPLKGLRREHLKQIMADKAETPHAANNLIKLLRVLLNYAVELGVIENNPATGIKPFTTDGDGFHTWTEDEIALFEATHPVGTRARLAHALLLYTGQRVSDVCRMGWQHIIHDVVNGDKIKVRQQKNRKKKKDSKPLMIPLHPELKAQLAMLPRTNMTFVVTEFGAPFTAAGLGTFVKKQCRVAGLPHCSAHGLRKAAATRFANAGCSVNEIASFTGHSSLREIARYTKAADQERMARQALNRQIGSEGERNLSNLQPQIIQPRVK